jgi:hypothetical protein
MSLDKALKVGLAGDGRPKRLQRSVPGVRFSMEKGAAVCFAEIQRILAEYACSGREFTMRLVGSCRVLWP